MGIRQKHVLLPAVTTAGSFLCLTLVALLTSPVKNIAFAVVFFVALLIFLVSLGYLITYAQKGSVGPRGRYRIVIISVSIVILLMFRSAQSLNLVDAIVLVLITIGLLFYSSRRAL